MPDRKRPDPPEVAHVTATPQQLVERLEILREQLRTGVLDTGGFNAALKAFQFTDELGRVWSPGATSGHWYRWDLDTWTRAEPPPSLRVPQEPVMFDDFERATSRPAAPPAARVTCPSCGAPAGRTKFCVHCGTRLPVP
jgi:hypothetical protein